MKLGSQLHKLLGLSSLKMSNSLFPLKQSHNYTLYSQKDTTILYYHFVYIAAAVNPTTLNICSKPQGNLLTLLYVLH